MSKLFSFLSIVSHVIALAAIATLIAIATADEFFFEWSDDEKMVQRNATVIQVNPPLL